MQEHRSSVQGRGRKAIVHSNEHRSVSSPRNETRQDQASRSHHHSSRRNNQKRSPGWNLAFARNKKIIELGRQNKWYDILRLYENERNDCFNNVNYATAMTQFARIRAVNTKDPLFHSFLNDYANRLESEGHQWLGTRQLANTLYAIGKMNLKHVHGARKFVTLSTSDQTSRFLARNGEPQEVANSAWAFAKYQVQSPTFFAELDVQAERLVRDGKPQEIANAAWACATLEVQAPNLFALIERNAKWLGMERPQAIANTAWACAKLGVKSPNLFAEVEKHAEWLVAESKTQEISNIVWACGTFEVRSPNLLSQIDKRATWFVRNGKPQEIAITAWSFARLGVHSPNLFSEIDQHAGWLVAESKTQEVANLAWACGALEVQSTNLFFNIEKHARWLVEEGLPQGIANTAWACGRLGVLSYSLFYEIEKHADWFVSEANVQEITNTVWACATLGLQSPGLFSGVERRVEDIGRDGKAQGLANMCYAFAVLDLMIQHQSTLAHFWESLISMHSEEITTKELSQLVQVQFFAFSAGICLKDPSPVLRTRMDQVMRSTAQVESQFQRRVSTILSTIGFIHETEVSPLNATETGGMLAIDIACRKQKVAIECDGPSHFLIASGSGRFTRIENGPTKAKRLFLERSGWTVINLKYQDWMEAKTKSGEKLFVRNKLWEGGVDCGASGWKDNQAESYTVNRFSPSSKTEETMPLPERSAHNLSDTFPRGDGTRDTSFPEMDTSTEQRSDHIPESNEEESNRTAIED